MRRFAWRLQRVLDLKEKEEQLRTAELLALTDKLARRRGELLMQQRMLKEMLNDIAKKQGQDRLSQQELFLKYCGPTDETIKRLKGRVSELELRQREKIAELTKVRRFKESLERLRAEAKKKFIDEQEKLEQKQFDEAATMKFAREMMETRTAASSADRDNREPAEDTRGVTEKLEN